MPSEPGSGAAAWRPRGAGGGPGASPRPPRTTPSTPAGGTAGRDSLGTALGWAFKKKGYERLPELPSGTSVHPHLDETPVINTLYFRG